MAAIPNMNNYSNYINNMYFIVICFFAIYFLI